MSDESKEFTVTTTQSNTTIATAEVMRQYEQSDAGQAARWKSRAEKAEKEKATNEGTIRIQASQINNLVAEQAQLQGKFDSCFQALREASEKIIELQARVEELEKENQRARVQVPLWKGIADAMVRRAKKVRCQFGGDHSIADCNCDPHQTGDAVYSMQQEFDRAEAATESQLRQHIADLEEKLKQAGELLKGLCETSHYNPCGKCETCRVRAAIEAVNKEPQQ